MGGCGCGWFAAALRRLEGTTGLGIVEFVEDNDMERGPEVPKKVGQRRCLPLTASLQSRLVGTLRPITLSQRTNPPSIRSGPVGYRRRGPVIPTPLPRGIKQVKVAVP
jgi:hypothetical protein